MEEDIWEIEGIPDESLLYYRIHKSDCRDGKVLPGAFKERGAGEKRGMSTNWDKYSDPEDLMNVAHVPQDNGVGQFEVEKVREMELADLKVVHDPDKINNNRSHTHIIGIPRKGQLKTKVRLKLRLLFTWVIPAPGITLEDE